MNLKAINTKTAFSFGGSLTSHSHRLPLSAPARLESDTLDCRTVANYGTRFNWVLCKNNRLAQPYFGQC